MECKRYRRQPQWRTENGSESVIDTSTQERVAMNGAIRSDQTRQHDKSNTREHIPPIHTIAHRHCLHRTYFDCVQDICVIQRDVFVQIRGGDFDIVLQDPTQAIRWMRAVHASTHVPPPCASQMFATCVPNGDTLACASCDACVAYCSRHPLVSHG